MLFEIYIPPELTDFDIIQDHLFSFLKFKNYLDKHRIIIYSLYEKKDFELRKFTKLDIQFKKISEDIDTLKDLWVKNIDIYREENWVVHYNLSNKLLEFDFIKMIFKKLKNTFVRRSKSEVYDNLFCIHVDLMFRFIIDDNKVLTPEFITRNCGNYYFLKYMNIVSKDKYGEYIYI